MRPKGCCGFLERMEFGAVLECFDFGCVQGFFLFDEGSSCVLGFNGFGCLEPAGCVRAYA